MARPLPSQRQPSCGLGAGRSFLLDDSFPQFEMRAGDRPLRPLIDDQRNRSTGQRASRPASRIGRDGARGADDSGPCCRPAPAREEGRSGPGSVGIERRGIPELDRDRTGLDVHRGLLREQEGRRPPRRHKRRAVDRGAVAPSPTSELLVSERRARSTGFRRVRVFGESPLPRRRTLGISGTAPGFRFDRDSLPRSEPHIEGGSLPRASLGFFLRRRFLIQTCYAGRSEVKRGENSRE